MTAWREGVRLAVGTLTIFPVRPPRLDRSSAGVAMMLAPVIGLGLATIVAGITFAVRSVAPLGQQQQSVNMLAAALAFAALAALTRGIHIDGLADTCDGLGSGKPAEQAREIMRKSDIGPFGVVAIIMSVLINVIALGTSLTQHHGSAHLITAVVAGRLALTWACFGYPSARTEGLGSLVARSVSRSQLALASVFTAAAIVGATALDPDATARSYLFSAAAPTCGLICAVAFLRHASRRFDGITGDVLGATVEITTTVTLVGLALS